MIVLILCYKSILHCINVGYVEAFAQYAHMSEIPIMVIGCACISGSKWTRNLLSCRSIVDVGIQKKDGLHHLLLLLSLLLFLLLLYSHL